MIYGFLIKEAIASCAIEHPTGCDCLVCRAAHGDPVAYAQVTAEVMAELDARQARA